MGVRGATAEYKCQRCQQPFTARVADRNRGWARFCSKSCKAIRQTQVTGRARPPEYLSWERYAETVHPFSSEAFEE